MNESAMNLERFLTAQASVMAHVMAELQAGRKQSHWMWFVFPQLAALGRSATAKFYGLRDLAEAKAYLAHPVLGARLVDCTRAVLAHAGKKNRTRDLWRARRSQVSLLHDAVHAGGAATGRVSQRFGRLLCGRSR